MPYKAIVRVKGGAGSGNWGHSGRPGLVGGSGGGGGAPSGDIDITRHRTLDEMTDAPSGSIAHQLLHAQSSKDITRAKKQAIATLDEAGDAVIREVHQGDIDYSQYRLEIAKRLPAGHPRSEGELDDWVGYAKGKLSAGVVQPRSAEEARADRILRIRDSSGRARARKW